MRVIRTENYEEMSREALVFVIERLPHIRVLGLATGGTPLRLYEKLIEAVRSGETSMKHVHTVNLDEYVGLAETHPQSYFAFMKKKLFDPLDLPPEQTHLPSGTAKDPEEECRSYETLIRNLGGIDLQMLGIGENGHIAFNEPGSAFDGRTSVVKLAPSTKEANARFFKENEFVPDKAVTMGIGTILEAKEILLLASGKRKAQAVRCMLEEEPSETCPASALKKHSRVTVIADEEALSLCRSR
jgi:glucosamine-6-phosphate deaminase